MARPLTMRGTCVGNFEKLKKLANKKGFFSGKTAFEKYGEMGVKALAKATPVRTGLTAASWSYEILMSDYTFRITWKNSNRNKGVPVALVIYYGHGTPTGGYVQGIDYITPAIQPIMDEIKEKLIKKIKEEVLSFE